MADVLSESDARTITRAIVRDLRSLGVGVDTFRIHLDREGFWFMAAINGQLVWARTGQGNVRYLDVAKELAAAALKASADPSEHVA